jgi:hypothetical protein
MAADETATAKNNNKLQNFVFFGFLNYFQWPGFIKNELYYLLLSFVLIYFAVT